MILNDKYALFSQILRQNGFQAGEMQEISYGIQFTVEKNGWTGLMRIFQNSKGKIKYDYSQLKDAGYTLEIMHLVESVFPDFVDVAGVGCDESGKGDYFGPLVCAAVYVKQSELLRLKSMGVRDSKSISDARIEKLAADIKKITGNAWSVFKLTPRQYNAQYEQFVRNGLKLNDLLAWAHVQAIENLLKRVPAQNLIIDQFAHPSLILNALHASAQELQVKITPKAENYTPVACASILARAVYVASVRELRDKYYIDFPKGASSRVIEVGREFISRYGVRKLATTAKVHFKTTKSITLK